MYPSVPTRTLSTKQKEKMDYVVFHLFPLLKVYRVRGFMFMDSLINYKTKVVIV